MGKKGEGLAFKLADRQQPFYLLSFADFNYQKHRKIIENAFETGKTLCADVITCREKKTNETLLFVTFVRDNVIK